MKSIMQIKRYGRLCSSHLSRVCNRNIVYETIQKKLQHSRWIECNCSPVMLKLHDVLFHRGLDKRIRQSTSFARRMIVTDLMSSIPYQVYGRKCQTSQICTFLRTQTVCHSGVPRSSSSSSDNSPGTLCLN